MWLQLCKYVTHEVLLDFFLLGGVKQIPLFLCHLSFRNLLATRSGSTVDEGIHISASFMKRALARFLSSNEAGSRVHCAGMLWLL